MKGPTPAPPSAERHAAIRQMLDENDAISTSPPVALQIFNLTRQPEYSSAELVRLVQLDPELTAQILRLVNSFHLRGNGVSSMDEAAMRIGAMEVTNTALAITMGRLVNMRSTWYCPDPMALWRHCVGCALASRHLRRVCTGVHADRDLVFTAGLLHDLGKIVINDAPPESLEVIVEVMMEEGISSADAELAVLGADHAEMGAQILERWNLPLELTNAVRYHHSPEMADSSLATLIHVGNCCAKVHAGSRGWQEFEEALHPHALERLGLSRWKIEDCWGDVLQSMDEIERFVGC